jgi:hypothetical protein
MSTLYSNEPGTVIEYGISYLKKGKRVFQPFGTFDSSESAFHDWKRDAPEADVQYDDWESHENARDAPKTTLQLDKLYY